MHRDWQTVKKILESIAGNLPFNELRADPEEAAGRLAYHLEMLQEAGYIHPGIGTTVTQDKGSLSYICQSIPRYRLTMKGHDLLDCIQYEGFWKVIDGLNKKQLNGPLDMIVELTHKLIRKEMLEYLQLTE